MEVTFRQNREKQKSYTFNKFFDAIVTDDKGQKWLWSETIGEREAEYQGPMSMLGPTHKTTAYDIPNYGLVPESLKYSNSIKQVILKRFKSNPEEFVPYYPARR